MKLENLEELVLQALETIPTEFLITLSKEATRELLFDEVASKVALTEDVTVAEVYSAIKNIVGE